MSVVRIPSKTLTGRRFSAQSHPSFSTFWTETSHANLAQRHRDRPQKASIVSTQVHNETEEFFEGVQRQMAVILIDQLIGVLQGLLVRLTRYDENNLISSILTLTVGRLFLVFHKTSPICCPGQLFSSLDSLETLLINKKVI
ncbi:unnamed protein product [Protopolystoma xenopodis]|uniref:Uncharacterized protein n=1 Tax=Protopolystoma xenopodis TaxID=117903 RepID=A0A3S5AML3_9PLAT|nr:unnamed protein product [Protopolystoma xenopodis]